MNRSFSLLQAAVCALILTGACLTVMPARAQSDYTYHPYHSDLLGTNSLFHSDTSQPDPYHYEPFHSTYDNRSDYHSPYDSSHSSDSEGGIVPPYHPFTMDPPYAPSSTPNYHFENGPDGNGTIVGPNGPVWHNGLGYVNTGALQKQGADATFVVPHARPLLDPKEKERFFDSPPGPYGSVTPIVYPPAPTIEFEP